MTLQSTARSYLRDAATAFNRAPAEVALAVLSAALFSYAIENDVRFEVWVQMAVAILMAFMAAWGGTLLHAMGALDHQRRWGLTLFGGVAAAVYAVSVDIVQREAEGWRALMLAAGIVLLALAAPALIRTTADSNLRLRRINGRIILRAIGIGLYGLALFAGLALALAAIENLFELNLDDEIYGHTIAWIMLVLVPWVIVGGLDSYLEPLDLVSDVARVVQRLASFLVPPLLALYYLILVLYVGRILITGELPKNLVSPMVLAAGLLTGLAVILFDPRPDDPRTGQRVLRWASALFIPIAPLGMWALVVRIDQYGWTEFRLLRVLVLVLLFVLAVLGTWQVLRRRPFTLRFIPVILAVPLLLGAVGPWSVLDIARRDQQRRLADALRAARIDPRTAVTDTTPRVVSRALYERINSAAIYLHTHFGEEALAEVMGRQAAQRAWGWAEHFHLMPTRNDTMTATLHGSLPPNANIPLTSLNGTLYRIQAEGTRLRVTPQRQLSIPQGADTFLVQIDSVIARMPPVMTRQQRWLPARALPVTDRSGQVRGELVIFEAMIQQTRDSVHVARLDGVLLIR
jgi:hypothetical protein